MYTVLCYFAILYHLTTLIVNCCIELANTALSTYGKVFVLGQVAMAENVKIIREVLQCGLVKIKK